MRRVVLESPYRGDIQANEAYALDCIFDCLSRGDAAIASHVVYTRVLDDTKPAQRKQGIGAGHAWIKVAEAVVVYTDRGISEGMRQAIELAESLGVPVEYRKL